MMTDPMDDLRQASADVSGVKVLSTAAQAVWDAAWQLSPVNCESHEDRRRQQIAAALRAAADQAIPLTKTPWGTTLIPVLTSQESRERLLAIATELENPQ